MTSKRPLYTACLVAISVVIQVFFSAQQPARGDEGGAYLPAFEQAYALWPALDLSPTWSISSFYLWVVAGLQTALGGAEGLPLLVVGRGLSLLCWFGLVLIHLRSGVYKALIVLFNPYVLIYSVRAHPFLPALLLFYLFWVQMRSNRWSGVMLLPVSVTFQVFMGGSIGLFMPRFPLQRREVLRVVGLSLVAVSGVLITWLTWGGLYPPMFVHHTFFQTYHVNTSPSFGYLLTVPMLAGSVLWFTGNRTLAGVKKHQTYIRAVPGSLIVAGIVLYLTAHIVGIGREGSQWVFRDHYQLGWVVAYVFIGLGWLRLHRDGYPLFFGLLGSAVLLVTLPYLYERISAFATIAPCLAWCSMQPNEPQQIPLVLTGCCFFILCFIAYQQFGSL